MKILEITVLYRKSTTADAYLSLLKKNGYLPKKIIELESPKGRKFKLIQKFFGKKITSKLLYFKNKKQKNTQYKSRLADHVMNSLPLNVKDLRIDPRNFSHAYQSIEINNLEDSKLHALLAQEECKTFLFTGGGMLSERLLSIPNSKFIHIHPGIVPDIKGADGLFWSILERNKPGYSCFYMNTGIDTGDILYQEEFDLPSFDIALQDYSGEEIYRGLLDYYDPVLRAMTLLGLVKESERNKDKLYSLPAIKQNPDEGRTYFYMHTKLRNNLIQKIIQKGVR